MDDGRGAAVVWIVLPAPREVIVLTRSAQTRHAMGERLPAEPALPKLRPEVRVFFSELE